MKLNNSIKIQNYKLKNFINSFFLEPDWQNLPIAFPKCDLTGLTIQEKCLFDAIVMAWSVQTKKGNLTIYKDIVKKTSISIAIIFSIWATNIIRHLPGSEISKSVNAATVSATLKQYTNSNLAPVDVGGVVESTFSGMLKKR